MSEGNPHRGSTPTWVVGEWEVRTAACELVRGDAIEKVAPRSMDVLTYLAERPGEVVSNDQLLDAFWRSGVSSTNAVYKAVTELRQAFGDGAKQSAYIQTVPKRGYRLIAPARRLEKSDESRIAIEPHAANGAVEAQQATLPASGPIEPRPAKSVSGKSSARAWGAVCGAAVSLMLLAVFAFRAPAGDDEACRKSTVEGAIPCGPAPPTSLAILRFENTDASPDADFLAIGIPDTLMEQLSKVGRITIAPRRDAYEQSWGDKSVAQIAKALHVENILEGEVQRTGDRLRVHVQLSRASDGAQLYAEKFDTKLGDILEVQDRLATQASEALKVHLDANERARMLENGTTNVEAFIAIKQSWYHYSKETHADLRLAADLARKAIALDHQYANAYNCLTIALARLLNFADEPEQRAIRTEIAELLADMRTLGLDESKLFDQNVYFSIALEGDYATAETLLRERFRTRPDIEYRHYWNYAYVLGTAGLFDACAAYTFLGDTKQAQTEGTPFAATPEPCRTIVQRGVAEEIARDKRLLAERGQQIPTLTGIVSLLAHEHQFDAANEYLAQLEKLDETGYWLAHAKMMLSYYHGEFDGHPDRLAQQLSDPKLTYSGRGLLLFLAGDIDGGVKMWREMGANESRVFRENRLFEEYHLSESVKNDPRYLTVLDELGTGPKWRAHLEAAVEELEPITGVGIHGLSPERAEEVAAIATKKSSASSEEAVREGLTQITPALFVD